jgi:hypothetical protein
MQVATCPPLALFPRAVSSWGRQRWRSRGGQPWRSQLSGGSPSDCAGGRCWQSHQLPPGHFSWRRSRHGTQIMAQLSPRGTAVTPRDRPSAPPAPQGRVTTAPSVPSRTRANAPAGRGSSLDVLRHITLSSPGRHAADTMWMSQPRSQACMAGTSTPYDRRPWTPGYPAGYAFKLWGVGASRRCTPWASSSTASTASTAR